MTTATMAATSHPQQNQRAAQRADGAIVAIPPMKILKIQVT